MKKVSTLTYFWSLKKGKILFLGTSTTKTKTTSATKTPTTTRTTTASTLKKMEKGIANWNRTRSRKKEQKNGAGKINREKEQKIRTVKLTGRRTGK